MNRLQPAEPLTAPPLPSRPYALSAHGRRRADIQGLRAIAVLLVVAFHAGLPVPGGFMGVDVFFVISGFVITSMLTAELESTGRLDLPRFYLRRARRLLPALGVMLTAVLVLAALVSPVATQGMTALTGLAASVFAANAYMLNVGTDYFDVSSELNPLLHTWTLGVEEQFYVLFPLILLAGWHLARRRGAWTGRSAAAAAIASVSIVSLSGGLLLSHAGWRELAFFASPTRAWEFGAGALLALGIPWVARLSGWSACAIGATGVAALAVTAFSGQLPLREAAPLVPVLGAVALIAAGSPGAGNPFSRALGTRPAVWIGDLSYSLYLWHWPLIVFATALWPGPRWVAAAAAALSFLPAWLSLRYVENPIRFGRWPRRRPLAAVAVACMLVPIALSFGLLGAKRALAAHPTMQSWARSQDFHADIDRGCDDPAPLGARRGGTCLWPAPGAHGEIVLVGDSQAGQFTEPVADAARRAGLDLTVATFPACPLVDVDLAGPGTDERRCRRFVRGTLEELERLKPRLVVVAARSDKYIESAEYRLRDPSGRLVTEPAEKARLWEQGLQRTLTRLERAGVPVLLVHPVPAFPETPQSCTTLGILTDGCSSSVSRESAEEQLHRARGVEGAAVAAVSNTSALDFEETLCGSDRCSTSRGDTILYRDGEHLSVDGALLLADGFYRAIVAHARR